MTRHKHLRRRPSTPNLKLPIHTQQQSQHTADPSPPDTPTTPPPLSRKISLKPRHQPPFFDENFSPLDQDPAIQPVGNGHQFSYRPRLAPEQMSPDDSSTSSEDIKDINAVSSSSPSVASISNSAAAPPSLYDEEENEQMVDDGASDADSESEEDNVFDNNSHGPSIPRRLHHRSIHITATQTEEGLVCDFVIEDVDPMDSENERLDVLFPTEVESIRSQSQTRSRTRQRGHLDPGMMHDFRNLDCSAEPSDDETVPQVLNDYDLDEKAFYRRRAELRRFRRVSMSSSFGKRTHSELSDSDPDDIGIVDVNEVGSSARRMRKRLHRSSLLFQDPPAPRIDELEEPDSSEDDFATGNSWAKELPYFSMEIFEIETP